MSFVYFDGRILKMYNFLFQFMLEQGRAVFEQDLYLLLIK